MFETVSKLIETKLGERDYKGALAVATKYRDTLTSAGDAMHNDEWVLSYTRCVEYVGDCLLGLNNPEGALREYEQALGMGGKLYSPTDDPNMFILFKIEKALARLSERLGTTASLKPLDATSDAGEVEEHQRRWKANLLLSAKERMATTHTTITASRVMKQTHLNLVWKETMEDAKKRKARLKATTGSTDNHLFGINRMWVELAASVILVSFTFFFGSFYIVNCIQKEPVGQNETEEKLLAENPSTSAYVIDRTFTVQGPPEDKLKFEKTEAVINADLDSFSVPCYRQCQSILDLPTFLFYTIARRCTWLERSPYGIKTPSGKVLFDITMPEYKLANYIHDFVGAAAETGEKPESGYTNPFTQTVQPVQFGNLKDQTIDEYVQKLGESFDLKPGTIICVKEKVRAGLNRYYGIAVGREKGLLVPLGLGADLYLSDSDQKKRLLHALGKPETIIVCDRSAKDALLVVLAVITSLCLTISLAPFIETDPLKMVFKVLSVVCILTVGLYCLNNL